MAGAFERCSDVACEGHLFFKQSRVRGLTFAQYHQFWGILRRESSTGGRRVELFGERSHAAAGVSPQAVLHLTDVLHVTEREAKGQRFAFQVLATSCKYHLATKTIQERQRWLDALTAVLYGPPMPGIVYEYRVQVLPNSHSQQLQLLGQYVLKISDTELALYTANGSLPTRFRCELTHILRTRSTTFIKDRKKLCMLVIYTRSCTEVFGGQYVFQSSSAADISATIDFRVKEMCRGENESEDGMPPSVTLNATDPIVLKSLSLPHKPLTPSELARSHSTANTKARYRVDIFKQSHSYPTQPHNDFTSTAVSTDDIIFLCPKGSDDSDDDEEGVAIPYLDEDGYVETRRPPHMFQPQEAATSSSSWKEVRAMSATPERHPGPRQRRAIGKQNQHQTGDRRHITVVGSEGMGIRNETADGVAGSDNGDCESAISASPPSIVPGVSVDKAGELATFQLHYRKSTIVPRISNVHAVVESPATKPTPKPRKNVDKPTPAPRSARQQSHGFRSCAHATNPTAETDHMSSHESHVTDKRTVHPAGRALKGTLGLPQTEAGLEESGVLFEERSAWLGAKQHSSESDTPESSAGLPSAELPYYLTILPPDHIPDDYQSVPEVVGGKDPLNSPPLLGEPPSSEFHRENLTSPLWGRSASAESSDEETLTPPGNIERATHTSALNGLLQPPSNVSRVGRYSLQVEKDEPFFLDVVHGEVAKTLISSDYTHSIVETSADTSNSGTGAYDLRGAECLSSSVTYPSPGDSSSRSTRESSDPVTGNSYLVRIPSQHRRSHSDVGEMGPFLRFDPLAKDNENIYTESLHMSQSAMEATPPPATPPPASPPLWSLRSRISPVTILSLQRPDSDSESEHSYTEPFMDSEDEAALDSEVIADGGGCGLDATGGYHTGKEASVDQTQEMSAPELQTEQWEASTPSDHGYSTVKGPLQATGSNPYSSIPTDGYSVVKRALEQTESNPYMSLGDQVAAPDSTPSPTLAPPGFDPDRRTSTDSGGYSFVRTPLANPYTSLSEILSPTNRPPAPLPSGCEENEETSVVDEPLGGQRGCILRRVKSHSAEDVRRSVIYEDVDRCYCYSVSEDMRAQRRVMLGSVGGAEECTYLTSKSSRNNHPVMVDCKPLSNGLATATPDSPQTDQSKACSQSDGSTSPDRPRKLLLNEMRAAVRMVPVPPPRPLQLKRIALLSTPV